MKWFPFSTFSRGHNVYVSVQNFKHCSCCVQTPLVGFLVLWAHYVCKFLDARCQPWLLLSVMAFIPVPLCQEGGGLGSISFVRLGQGAMAELRWAGTLFKAKITHLLGFIFVLARTRKKLECAAFNYTNSLIGDIAMHGHIHVVKSCPWWSHTWRYTPSPCHALPWIHVVAIQMVNVLSHSRRWTQICAVQCRSLDQVA